MTPLGLLGTGEEAEVLEIRGRGRAGSCGRDCRVEDMGLRTGRTVRMLNNEGGGPLLMKVGESRIAMGRGTAMKILVRRKN